MATFDDLDYRLSGAKMDQRIRLTMVVEFTVPNGRIVPIDGGMNLYDNYTKRTLAPVLALWDEREDVTLTTEPVLYKEFYLDGVEYQDSTFEAIK